MTILKPDSNETLVCEFEIGEDVAIGEIEVDWYQGKDQEIVKDQGTYTIRKVIEYAGFQATPPLTTYLYMSIISILSIHVHVQCYIGIGIIYGVYYLFFFRRSSSNFTC